MALGFQGLLWIWSTVIQVRVFHSSLFSSLTPIAVRGPAFRSRARLAFTRLRSRVRTLPLPRHARPPSLPQLPTNNILQRLPTTIPLHLLRRRLQSVLSLPLSSPLTPSHSRHLPRRHIPYCRPLPRHQIRRPMPLIRSQRARIFRHRRSERTQFWIVGGRAGAGLVGC